MWQHVLHNIEFCNIALLCNLTCVKCCVCRSLQNSFTFPVGKINTWRQLEFEDEPVQIIIHTRRSETQLGVQIFEMIPRCLEERRSEEPCVSSSCLSRYTAGFVCCRVVCILHPLSTGKELLFNPKKDLAFNGFSLKRSDDIRGM